jgi:hypothetical protein
LTGYIDPITTGAPFRFAVVDAPAEDPDVAGLPPLLLLVLVLVPAHAAVASATQAKPETRRSHFVAIISPSPAGARTPPLYQGTLYFGAISGHSIPSEIRWSMGTEHSFITVRYQMGIRRASSALAWSPARN